MRTRSKTNSRKHEDIALRNAYLDDRKNQPCEIIHLFPRWLPGSVRVPLVGSGIVVSLTETPACVHHVGSGMRGAGRWDFVGNFAAVCDAAHKFCESQWGGWPHDGFVLCRYAKTKAGTWEEEKMCEMLGCESTLDWLTTRPIEHEFAQDLLAAMIVKESA